MEKDKKNNKIIWIAVVVVVFIIILALLFYKLNDKKVPTANQINLGDIVVLNKEQREQLRHTTINKIESILKAPSTAKFEETFTYICIEPNIVRVEGYTDSQNSFGAMIRDEFICEYLAIDDEINTLVYLSFGDEEILNIKESCIRDLKEQKKLEEIKSSGSELNQEKLDYIMNEFNSEEWNNVGKITSAIFDEKESSINVEITAKKTDDYWFDFNICSIMDYIKEFDIVGIIKVKLFDSEKVVEITFDDEFVKNKWNENHQIDLVKEIFGENYKEI